VARARALFRAEILSNAPHFPPVESPAFGTLLALYVTGFGGFEQACRSVVDQAGRPEYFAVETKAEHEAKVEGFDRELQALEAARRGGPRVRADGVMTEMVGMPPVVRVRVRIPVHGRNGQHLDDVVRVYDLNFDDDFRAPKGAWWCMPLYLRWEYQGTPIDARRELSLPLGDRYANVVECSLAPVVVGPEKVEQMRIERDEGGEMIAITREHHRVAV
jgi:hypothetical protein